MPAVVSEWTHGEVEGGANLTTPLRARSFTADIKSELMKALELCFRKIKQSV